MANRRTISLKPCVGMLKSKNNPIHEKFFLFFLFSFLVSGRSCAFSRITDWLLWWILYNYCLVFLSLKSFWLSNKLTICTPLTLHCLVSCFFLLHGRVQSDFLVQSKNVFFPLKGRRRELTRHVKTESITLFRESKRKLWI